MFKSATLIFLLLQLLGSGAIASSTRSTEADSLISTDHLTTWVLPPGGGTLLTTATSYKPTQQQFIASGTYGLSYWFTVSSANCTSGSTYTNNSNTFTCVNTASSSALIWFSSNGAPTSSGTLTKASGTGDATITFSAAKAPSYIKVRIVGAGGGGSGGGGSGAVTGGSGGTSSFGSIASCGGGGSGGQGGNSAMGGTCSALSGADFGIIQQGNPTTGIILGTGGSQGGMGGSSPFGGGGGGSWAGSTAIAAATNSGSGGGGGGSGGTFYSGQGGSSGGYASFQLSSPSPTYSITIGTGGVAGAAGSGGGAGAPGADGFAVIEEIY